MSVHPDELTGAEQAVLLVLMAECRPVANAQLKTFGPALTKPQREKLLEKGLIEVHGKPMVVELSDKGWRMCGEIIGTDVPVGVTGQGRTLYTLMRSLKRYFEREDLRPNAVFAAAGPVVEVASVTTRVRSAYAALADRPGAWIGLRRLREALQDVPRTDLDGELLRLYQEPGVSLIPEENQKVLTDADRAASIRIGNKDNHVIAIHS